MLSEAITQEYGHKQGLIIIDEKIVEWPYDVPVPDEAKIQELKNKAVEMVQKNRNFEQQKKECPDIIKMMFLVCDQLDNWAKNPDNNLMLSEQVQNLIEKINLIKSQHPTE